MTVTAKIAPTVPVERTVTIEMPEGHAKILRGLLHGHITGYRTGPRGKLDAIDYALKDAGVSAPVLNVSGDPHLNLV